MSPEQAIKSLVLSVVDITSAIADRIYPDGAVPQNATRPFASLGVMDSKQSGDIGGASSVCREKVSLSFFAETRSSAKTLAEYASRMTPNGLVNYSGTVTSGADSLEVMGVFYERSESGIIDFDDGSDLRLFRETSEYIVVYEK